MKEKRDFENKETQREKDRDRESIQNDNLKNVRKRIG